LWNVTRSTRPASTSWVDDSGCGFIRIAGSSVLSVRPASGNVKHDVCRHHYSMAAGRSQEACGFVSRRRGYRTAPQTQIDSRDSLRRPKGTGLGRPRGIPSPLRGDCTPSAVRQGSLHEDHQRRTNWRRPRSA
jgi:hypothetical protein